MSRHQIYIAKKSNNTLLTLNSTKPVVNIKAPKEATTGHGLGSTKW
jgi:hypothetical protein